jgi:hypothetical protein
MYFEHNGMSSTKLHLTRAFKKQATPNDIQLFSCSSYDTVTPLCVHRERFVLSFLLFAPFVTTVFALASFQCPHEHSLIIVAFLFRRLVCLPCLLYELTAFVPLFMWWRSLRLSTWWWKVKCNFSPLHDIKAYNGSRSIAPLIRTTWWWLLSFALLPLYFTGN